MILYCYKCDRKIDMRNHVDAFFNKNKLVINCGKCRTNLVPQAMISNKSKTDRLNKRQKL